MAITISGSGITSANIADGTIVNADINSSAAIDGSKLTGAGKVLQVVQSVETVSVAVSTTTATDIMSVVITPSSTTSKILITSNIFYAWDNTADNNQWGYKIDRNGTVVDGNLNLYSGEVWSTTIAGTQSQHNTKSFIYLDSPATTAAITYKFQAALRSPYTNNAITFGLAENCRIVVMEIGA